MTWIIYGTSIFIELKTPQYNYRIVFLIAYSISVIFWLAGWYATSNVPRHHQANLSYFLYSLSFFPVSAQNCALLPTPMEKYGILIVAQGLGCLLGIGVTRLCFLQCRRRIRRRYGGQCGDRCHYLGFIRHLPRILHHRCIAGERLA